jgi:hypothetical protein
VIFGNPKEFAIEAELFEKTNSDSYGHFRFWVCGQSIGDFQEIISLTASKRHLLRFLAIDDQRFEERLEKCSKEEVFKALFESIMVTIAEGMTITEYLKKENSKPQDFSYLSKMDFQDRFHLDEVGGESVRDKVNIVLLKRKDSFERIIWRDLKTMLLMEAVLSSGNFRETAEKFLSWIP